MCALVGAAYQGYAFRMHSLVIKIFCVLFALFCIGWYVQVYEPALYAQFNAILTNTASDTPAVPDATQSNAQPQLENPTPVRADTLPPLTWIFTEALPDESLSMPRTAVALKVGCAEGQAGCVERTIPAGTFAGLCAVIERPESANELTGVLCWFAGAGDEIGVFEHDGALLLQRGEIAEPTAESDGFRGNFVTITTL